ncbi:MAG: hypothetical protein AMS27_01800 [Bacteroides sp. SM23_62_1]|nr:MAG: hypothetical protein AMS27_01800 [Bacteroides sp. SM23_62_1]
MQKCFKFFLFLALTGIVFFTSPGCGGSKNKKSSEEIETTENLEEEISEAEYEELILPADFPDDIAVYPDGELEVVHKLHPDSIWHFEFAIKEDLDKVASYYKDEFTKNGWTAEGESGSVEIEVVAFNFLKDGRTVLFDIRPDERYSDDMSESWDIIFVRMDYFPLGYFE